MALPSVPIDRDPSLTDYLGGLCLLPGAALVAAGAYFHLAVAAQVRAGACDGCEPWHPLLVVAPLVVGLGLLALGAALVRRDR